MSARVMTRLAAPTHSRLLPLGTALIVIVLGLRAWALSGAWFYFDDLAFVSRALNQPLDVHHLTESYGGHLMPGGFLAAYVLAHTALWSWPVWAATLLAMQGVAAFGMLRLLRSMFGEHPVVLALLLAYLVCAITLPVSLWWAAGINQLPLQIALVMGLHAHLAYLRSRRTAKLAETLAWLVFGLCFYEKTLLLFGVFGLVAISYFCTGPLIDRCVDLWRRYRWGVVAHTVLALAYTAIYARFGLDFGTGAATSQPWTPVAYNLVGVAFASAVVGGPVHWTAITVGAIADPSQLLLVVAWISLGGLAWYAAKTRTRSRRAWAPLIFTLAANTALIVAGRAVIVGPEIGKEYRYQTESAPLFVLGCGLALLPLLGAIEVNAVRPEAPRTYETRRYVVALMVVVTALATVSSVRYATLWASQNRTHTFYSTIRASLRSAPMRPVPMADQGLPQDLLWSFRYPENTYAHVFRGLPGIAYPRLTEDHLYLFTDRGQLSPALVSDVRDSLPGPARCGYRLYGKHSADIDLNGPVLGDGWWVRLGYAAKGPVTVRIVAGDQRYRTTLRQGLHNVFFQASGAFHTIVISRAADSSTDPAGGLCVGSISLGTPTAVASS